MTDQILFPAGTLGCAAGSPRDAVQTAAQYEVYYGKGHYDARYPRPNPRLLRLVAKHLQPSGRLLDYGCGSGRYLLPLASGTSSAIGFDISATALATLRKRSTEMGQTNVVQAIGPNLGDLDEHLEHTGLVDLAICLFGVLSHITDDAARHAALVRLRRAIDPGRGRVILSVPNKRRRFRNEQRDQTAVSSGRINYTRTLGADRVDLGYRLYDTETLRSELAEAGLEVEAFHAESCLPENIVASHPNLARLDGALSRLCPSSLGYGIVAVARPA